MSLRRLTRSRASGVLLIAAIVAAWQLWAVYGTESPNWPAVTAIAVSLIAAIRSGELLEVFSSSLSIMLAGYAIGVLAGIVVGFGMAMSRLVHAALSPLVELLRPIPIPAVVPPLILIFGIDHALKIFVIAFTVFFPVVINTIGGVRSVDPIALDVGRTLRVGRGRMLGRVVLPASLPYILAGMRTGLSLALLITVTAEMIAGSAGIGYYLMTMQYAMRASDMYATIALLAAVGYALNRLFLAVEQRLLHWYDRADAA